MVFRSYGVFEKIGDLTVVFWCDMDDEHDDCQGRYTIDNFSILCNRDNTQ